MLSASGKNKLTHLYRSLLRAAHGYSAYNFRDHAQRRVQRVCRERFAHTSESPSAEEASLKDTLHWGQVELAALQRQSLVNSLFQVDRLVVEASPA